MSLAALTIWQIVLAVVGALLDQVVVLLCAREEEAPNPGGNGGGEAKARGTSANSIIEEGLVHGDVRLAVCVYRAGEDVRGVLTFRSKLGHNIFSCFIQHLNSSTELKSNKVSFQASAGSHSPDLDTVKRTFSLN